MKLNRLPFHLTLLIPLFSFTLPAMASDDVTPAPAFATAKEVIDRVVTYFSGLHSYMVDVMTVMRTESPGMKQEQKSAYAVSMRSPNLFSMTPSAGGFGLFAATVVSDGTHLYTYAPFFPEYETDDAPENLTSAFIREVLDMPPAALTYGVASLRAVPYIEDMPRRSTPSYVGLEDFDGVKCHHLKFQYSAELDLEELKKAQTIAGVPEEEQLKDEEWAPQLRKIDCEWDVWIDAGDSPLPRGMFQDLSKEMQGVFERIGSDLSAGTASAEAPDFLRAMFKNMKSDVTVTFENWRINVVVPDETFKFTPPTGAKLRERPSAPSNEGSAWATLISLPGSEKVFRAMAEVDQDGDRVGEYGFLQELVGLAPLRGGESVTELPYFPSSLGENMKAGIAMKSGYLFRIYLPGDNGAALTEGDSRPLPSAHGDAVNLQELHFVCYAWPVEVGVTGNRAFVVTDEAEIWQTAMDKVKYEGRESIPPASAAYRAEPFTSPLGGSDGNTWQPAHF